MLSVRGAKQALLLALALTVAPALAETRSLSQAGCSAREMSRELRSPIFDDWGWRPVTVPHDWSIMDKADGSPPFDPYTFWGIEGVPGRRARLNTVAGGGLANRGS